MMSLLIEIQFIIIFWLQTHCVLISFKLNKYLFFPVSLEYKLELRACNLYLNRIYELN